MPAAALARPDNRAVDHVFEAVLRREARRLFGIAYSILRDPHEAEDALQEVMVRAWKSWAKTEAHDDPGPWLTRICVNQCINRGSALRLRRSRSAALDATVAGAVPVESDPRLATAYERLSRQQRAVVLLHYHHGYSLDECAGLMGCRPGTARSHLNRALSALREVLGDD